MLALFGPDGVLAALAAVQCEQGCVRTQSMREVGKQRGGFVIGVGHDEHDTRHDARLLDRFERVRKSLAPPGRNRFLLRCERQCDEQCEDGESEPAFHHSMPRVIPWAIPQGASPAAANGHRPR